jgi:serine/threonine protein kinase
MRGRLCSAGDLKLQNFCLSEPRASGKPLDDLLRIIDMGLSQRIRVGNYIYGTCGTLEYIAPEIVTKQFDHKVDMWSLGIILYQLITVYFLRHGVSTVWCKLLSNMPR